MSTNTNIYAGEEKNGNVKVNLSTSTFGDDKVFYGKVVKDLVTASNFYTELQDELPEISEGIIFAVGSAIQKRMLKLLQKGYAVDCLALGVFRIATSGTTDSTTGTIPLTVKFSPSDLVKEAIGSVQISEVAVSTPSITIDKIIDVTTGNSDNTLSLGGSVEIIGNGLKVLGSDGGVWLAELDADGNYSNDQTTWQSVQRIHYNYPKKLEVILPSELNTESKYVIIVKTRSSSSGGSEIKTIRTAVSETVTIV